MSAATRAIRQARRASTPAKPYSLSSWAIASVEVTGRSAASARTDSASCFARSVPQGKFVSLIAAQMSA